MTEMIFTVIACFVFLVFGAFIGVKAQKMLMKPFIDLIEYMVRHVASHDLQVYHGISEVDRATNAPHQRPRSDTIMGLSPEELAMELERMNGDLPPTAE